MARGKCVNCKKDLGGLFSQAAYICTACNKCYCKDCSDKVGFLIKNLLSKCCGRELKKI